MSTPTQDAMGARRAGPAVLQRSFAPARRHLRVWRARISLGSAAPKRLTHLPRTGSSVAGRQDLGRTTWSVDLVRVGADGSLHWLRVWPTREEHTRHGGLELWMAVQGYQIVSKPVTWYDWCPDESG
jgi:hypothetical protein